MTSLLFSFYFACLLQFSFVSHPMVYCMLLLCCCLSGAAACYIILGFSWYIILLCLVYVGGVYMLFMFISMHSPNPKPSLGAGLSMFTIMIPTFYFILFFVDFSSPSFMDSSHFLCSFFEGFSYCLLCMVLLLGFLMMSVVSSDKGSFYR